MEDNNLATKGNFLFVGLCILGVGFGFLFGNIPAGSIIGVGLAFVAKAYIK